MGDPNKHLADTVTLADHSIAIVMLAAGRGQRMGSQPKLLLPLSDGRPILRHTVENALELMPTELIVVVRPDLPALAAALESLAVKCVPNPRYTEGMSTSLQRGIGALNDSVEAVLLMLADEPFVPHGTVNALVSAYLEQRKPITIPMYDAQVGPPTLFARSIFPDLMLLQGDTGGRQLMSRYPDRVCFVSLAESDRPRDIDTAEDYEALRTIDDGR